MPREHYQLANINDLEELNRILDSISRRLNHLAQDGDDIDVGGRRFTNLEAGTDDRDSIRKDQIVLIGTTAPTAERLAKTDSANELASVTDLTAWIAGTALRITVTDDGDGTLTLTIPDTPTLVGLLLSGLTASRLLASDGTKNLTSVANLASWIAGTTNEITVTDDGDGTITISGAGDGTDFTVLTAIQAGGGGALGIQYKTRALTLNGGIITTVGAESGWNDI